MLVREECVGESVWEREYECVEERVWVYGRECECVGEIECECVGESV